MKHTQEPLENDITMKHQLGAFNQHGQLCFLLKDGAEVHCMCFGEPLTSRIIETISSEGHNSKLRACVKALKRTETYLTTTCPDRYNKGASAETLVFVRVALALTQAHEA